VIALAWDLAASAAFAAVVILSDDFWMASSELTALSASFCLAALVVAFPAVLARASVTLTAFTVTLAAASSDCTFPAAWLMASVTLTAISARLSTSADELRLSAELLKLSETLSAAFVISSSEALGSATTFSTLSASFPTSSVSSPACGGPSDVLLPLPEGFPVTVTVSSALFPAQSKALILIVLVPRAIATVASKDPLLSAVTV